MKGPPSLAALRAALRPLGIAITRTDVEYRVREVGSPAGCGYFTDDAEDALNTGRAMALHRMRASAPVRHD